MRKEPPEEAVVDYATAIRLEPENPLHVNNRGEMWYWRHDYQRAYEDFTAALRINPRYSSALTAKARLLSACPEARFRCGRRAKFLAEQARKETRGINFYALTSLGTACAELGEFDEAVEWQEKALELNRPSDSAECAAAQERIKCYRSRHPWRDE